MTDPTPDLEAPAVEPGPAASPPPGTTPAPAPSPSTRRPVVLATPLLTEFVVPADGDGSEELRIGPGGVALSRKDADRITSLAAASGVPLLDITPAEKD